MAYVDGIVRDAGGEVHSIINPAYGARADGRTASGSISAASAQLTVSAGVFAGTDVGKRIVVVGAGPAGAALPTTISAYGSPTQVTLAAPASTTVVGGTAANLLFSTDDRDAIQSTLDALSAGQAAFISTKPSPAQEGFAGIASGLVTPDKNAIAIRGQAFRGGQIRAMAGGFTMLGTTTTWPGVAYQSFRDLYLNAAGLADVCQHMRSQSRGDLERVVYEGALDVGLKVEDCMMLGMRRGFFYGNRDGLRVTNLGNTGLNGVDLEFFAEGNTRYGADFQNGVAGARIYATVQGNGSGIRFGQDAVAIELNGYFEANNALGPGSFDVYVGEDAQCKGGTVTGYFDGSTSTDYMPIRVKHATGWTFRPRLNTNVGPYLFHIESGGVLYDCTFAPQYIGGSVPSDPRTVYRYGGAPGFPDSFADGGNRVDDPRVCPLLPGNHVRNGWTLASAPSTGEDHRWGYWLAGGSTFAASGTRWRGGAAHRLARGTSSTPTCQLQYTLPVSATDNAEVRGRFVTFAVPVLPDGAGGTLKLAVIQEGHGYLKQRSLAIPGGDPWRVYHVHAFVPGTFTGNLFLDVLVDSGSPAFLLGDPAFYVGVAPLP
jgi:hypothetical protein